MTSQYRELITDYAYANYKSMFREPSGILNFPFIVPGACYDDSLWDWDSYFTNVAIRQLFEFRGESEDFIKYERGSVINFLEKTRDSGCTPHLLTPVRDVISEHPEYETNTHKPILAQHVAFVLKETGEDTKWFKPYFHKLDLYMKGYIKNQRHENGIFFWIDDTGIGVDNDPCTFFRPKRSSGSIYINCLMYKEFLAMEYVCNLLGETALAAFYKGEGEALKKAVRENCWDEHDGFYYSVDLNLLPINLNQELHSGAPRDWDCLIQRIGCWSGFMAIWAGIATPEQAKRMVYEHLLNFDEYNSNYGVRTLAKYEKMYQVVKTGNPSCWLGPIWGISNYLTFAGLVDYGFQKEARELAEKTVKLLGEDVRANGVMSEYYHPDTGAPINNPGFQNWNLLSLNMMAWLDGDKMIREF